MDENHGFDLGARLKALRDSHNLSQRELAKRRRGLQRHHFHDRAEPVVPLGRHAEEAAGRFPHEPCRILRRRSEAAAADLLLRPGTGRVGWRPCFLPPGRAAT